MCKVKAYCVYEDGQREVSAELVFHSSCNKARELALEACESLKMCSTDTVKVLRLQKADGLRQGHEPYVETREEFLRAAGWGPENSRYCGMCGLSDFNRDQWRVDTLTEVCVDCQEKMNDCR